MVLSQKKAAITVVGLYLTTSDERHHASDRNAADENPNSYTATAGTRLAFRSRSWTDPDYPLISGWTALATFSQLVFPMTVLCLGKLSKFLDLESYFSSAIGADSRKTAHKSSHQYYLPQNYGRNMTNASGPAFKKKMYTDSVEEIPLRDRSRSSRQGGSGELDVESSDAITVKRDVDVRSERGDVND